MSELTKRIVFAVPAASLFLYITWLGDIYFITLVILIALFIQREQSIMMDSAGFTTDNYFPYTIGLWILLIPFLPNSFAIGLALFLIFILMQVFKTGERAIKELISTFFCSTYVPFGFLTLLLIRSMGSPESGFLLTLSLLLMVWGNDILAYFGGKTFGKHMLAPTVSPKKTWEGFFFGMLGAFLGLAVVIYLIPMDFPLSGPQAFPSIVMVSIFGPVGDLTESRLKRAAKIKDASTILPGHGGLFDRFDAMILAAPAFYLYLYLLKIMDYVSF